MRNEIYWRLEEWKRKKTPKGIVIVKNLPSEKILTKQPKPNFTKEDEMSKLQAKLSLSESDLKNQIRKNKQLKKK